MKGKKGCCTSGTGWRAVFVILSAALPFMAAACAEQRSEPATGPASAAAPMRPLVAFVASAAPAEGRVINDSELGEVYVVMDHEYSSASGETCRRFSIRPANAGSVGLPESRAICGKDGHWSLVGIEAPR